MQNMRRIPSVPAASAAARRAFFSQLANKIHPQLPLTPRESQQLLNLLKASFRNHLDREHPVATPDAPLPSSTTQIATLESVRQSRTSSYSSATEHIDSILSNPLLARKPRRRTSDSATVELLKDPLAWFLDHVAIGSADLNKASMCLEVVGLSRRGSPARQSRPASAVAQWLQTSGQETSKEFLFIPRNTKPNHRAGLLTNLVPVLLAEGNQAPLWRWYTYSPEQRNDSAMPDVMLFRQRLLQAMIHAARTRDEALQMFLRAYRITKGAEQNTKVLRLAGGLLVDKIVADPKASCTVELYNAFANSVHNWLRSWSKVAEAMLFLCHPAHPDPQPGLAFINDPKGAICHINTTGAKRRFFVQMCLGVAQQLIKEEKYADAQVVMKFASQMMDDTDPTQKEKSKTKEEKINEEKENIAMLDRLLFT